MFSSPTFWLLVSFILFILGSLRPVIQKVSLQLRRRTEDIQSSLERAEQAYIQAKEFLEKEQIYAQAVEKETEKMIQDAQNESHKLRQHILKEFEKKLQYQGVLLQERLNFIHKQIEQEAVEKIISLSFEKVKDHIRTTSSPEDHLRYIDQQLTSIEKL